MRALRYLVATAAVVGLVLVATPAQAMDKGTYLKTGDMFCTITASYELSAA